MQTPHTHIRRQRAGQPVYQVLLVSISGQVDVRDLPGGVHAGIGAAGDSQRTWPAVARAPSTWCPRARRRRCVGAAGGPSRRTRCRRRRYRGETGRARRPGRGRRARPSRSKPSGLVLLGLGRHRLWPRLNGLIRGVHGLGLDLVCCLVRVSSTTVAVASSALTDCCLVLSSPSAPADANWVFSRRLGLGGDGPLPHQLDDRHGRVVALARQRLRDAGVATVAVAKSGPISATSLCTTSLSRITFMISRRLCRSPRFALVIRRLGVRTQPLRLGLGGGDPAVR